MCNTGRRARLFANILPKMAMAIHGTVLSPRTFLLILVNVPGVTADATASSGASKGKRPADADADGPNASKRTKDRASRHVRKPTEIEENPSTMTLGNARNGTR
jgi:hypothetical protein